MMGTNNINRKPDNAVKKLRKSLTFALAFIMALTIFSVPVSALEGNSNSQTGAGTVEQLQTDVENSGEGQSEDQAAGEAGTDVNAEEGTQENGEAADTGMQAMNLEIQSAVSKGTEVTGTFAKQSGKDVATVRYYTDAEKTTYAFAEVTESSSGYTYSFNAPYDGFEAAEGTEVAGKDLSSETANVIAEYYSTTKWDGAVDVSWYNEESTSFNISNPAEFAGFAAIVNGSINNTTPIYMVKGDRSDDRAEGALTFDYDTPQTSSDFARASDFDGAKVNEGLPNCIENEYYENTALAANVQDEAYKGLAKYDFADKTINIVADLDMGGATNVDESKNNVSNAESGKNSYDYPNWTPIGGEYLMDPSDASTMIIAFFNGTIDGKGHEIKNLYCFRWSYLSVAETAYGYAQGTGLVGSMASLYYGEDAPSVMPGLKNMSLSGFVCGRRMVGGFVGYTGGGSNSATKGTAVTGNVVFENLANHADVYCTDSKGLGGIIGCSMLEQSSVINCYNTGNLTAYYEAPSGGIVGSNEGTSIYCCYNTGKIEAEGSRGRAIGCDNSGSNYTVDDCYYLEGSGNDDRYPGYYTPNLAKSVSVNVTSMKASEMTNGDLLDKLNVNGTAYVKGDDGYPVLCWEKNATSGSSSFNLSQVAKGGKISATVDEGAVSNGTVIYLSYENADGYKCRYFTLNGEKLSGNYVTINGNSTISAFFEEVKPGSIKLEDNDYCTFTVEKNGTVIEDGSARLVEHYDVANGDSLYEGDLIMIYANLNTGATPEDEDLVFAASVDGAQPYTYTYKYIDADGETVSETESSVATFTVDSTITEQEEIRLSVSVTPVTTQKMWDHIADTSWYNDTDTTFTINTATQLAGLSVLVDEGNTFEGKTIKLGKDISLQNNDGTNGNRFWDGIGSYQNPTAAFGGTFDGNNHSITNYNGNKNGLFEYCDGATVKNLTLKGYCEGQYANGIIARAKDTNVDSCTSYCEVVSTKAGSAYAGGIVGYATGSSAISKCYNYGPVWGQATNGEISGMGGIAGYISSKSVITNCVNNGNVIASNKGCNAIGGIVGDLNGEINHSGNYGNIVNNTQSVGGIAGRATNTMSKIEYSYNVGQVEVRNAIREDISIGGIIGYASIYQVSNSFNYGNIEYKDGTLNTNYIGAVFGQNGKNSKSKTENVYYLEDCCLYATSGKTYDEIDRDVNYENGIVKATANEFKSEAGVLTKINSDGVFSISSGSKYPQIAMAQGMHIHSGGSDSTCSVLSICDVCGLAYGLYSDVHLNTETKNHKEPVWNINGYTGDLVCSDCGEIIEKGESIIADTSKEAITVEQKIGSKVISSKTYTVAQFDALKTNSPTIAYSYGGTSTEMMVASEYVTLAKLMEEDGLTTEDLESVTVKYGSGSDTVSVDTLTSCNKYYDADGNESSAEAAFAIKWNTGSGDVKTVAKDSITSGNIRFGYGISQTQYKNKTAVGGRRLISPVSKVTFNLTEAKVDYTDGEEQTETCYLSEAIEKANASGGTIKLVSDVDTGNSGFIIDATGYDINLDLNGFEILSNREYCIEVNSGNLTISDSSDDNDGVVNGKVTTDNGTLVAAEGTNFTYELEADYCEDGCVPELDAEIGLYTIVKKSAYESAINNNALTKVVGELEAKIAKINKQLTLLGIEVTATAKTKAYNSIELAWEASDTVDAFKVQKKENGEWVDLDTTDLNYIDVAEPGVSNEYRVAAGLKYEDVNGESIVFGKYVEISAKTSLAKATVSKLTTKSNKLTVIWKSVEGADSYDIYIGTNSGVSKGLVKYTNKKGTKLTTKALSKNKKYYVKVRARYKTSQGSTVYGAWSTVKAIKCK